MGWEDRHPAPQRGMIRRPRRVRVQLLRRAGWIRTIVIVGWRWSLGGRLVRRGVRRPGRSRIAARRIVLPHVDAALGGTGQLPYVVHGIVRSRVGVVGALAHQLALRQETALGAVARHHGAAGSTTAAVVPLLYIIVCRGLVHSYKIRPANLRRRARVRSATETRHSGIRPSKQSTLSKRDYLNN